MTDDTIREAAAALRHAAELAPSQAERFRALAAQLGEIAPDFVTITEAAELLRVSDETIRRRMRSGELKAKRLRTGKERGRSALLFARADVLGLLEDARDEAGALPV